MQQAILSCPSECIEAPFFAAMVCIFQNNQRIVEKESFRLRLTDVMFVSALPAVPVIPFKSGDLVKIDYHVYDQYIRCWSPNARYQTPQFDWQFS